MDPALLFGILALLTPNFYVTIKNLYYTEAGFNKEFFIDVFALGLPILIALYLLENLS